MPDEWREDLEGAFFGAWMASDGERTGKREREFLDGSVSLMMRAPMGLRADLEREVATKGTGANATQGAALKRASTAIRLFILTRMQGQMVRIFANSIYSDLFHHNCFFFARLTSRNFAYFAT